jgi:hypothetical protein
VGKKAYLCILKIAIMLIKVKGHDEEAYALIMQRKYAQDIIDGVKSVETRGYSSKYVAMFFDKQRLAAALADPDAKIDEECYRDVRYVHFYTRNVQRPWWLDCRIDEIGSVRLVKGDEGIAHLAEAYNFHEFDDQLTDDEDNAPMCFYLHIVEIVGHSGL